MTDRNSIAGRIFGAALCVVLALLGPAEAAGFRFATVPDPGNRPIEIGIWYPSNTPAPAEPNTPFGQALAREAPVAGEKLPLIVISHGRGGWIASHADTALALAEAGYVVVAPAHPGDNDEDESAPPPRWIVDRPRHIARVIDFMLGTWPAHGRLDPTRIGMFGFSAGGYTALVAIGGVPNLRLAAERCAADPQAVDPPEVFCKAGVLTGFEDPKAIADAEAAAEWVHEPRIRAAVIAAPGLGYAFDAKALAGVTTPVQLWNASADHNVPYATNGEVVLNALPTRPEAHLVEGVGHFVFRPPCRPQIQAALPEIWKMACVDPPGFNRAAFHRTMNAAILLFFDNALGPH